MVARKLASFGLTTAIVIAVLAMFLIPPAAPSTLQGPTVIHASTPSPRAVVAQPVPMATLAPAASHPSLTFPRTVLVETFTGVWCPHCPSETQALWSIDANTPKNVVSIAELHSCAYAPGQGPCYDNYVAPDNIQGQRASFYNICGYPDVFIDGIYGTCGGWPEADLYNWYNANISAESAIPANVGVADTAWIANSSVDAKVAVTSGVTGSYNEITYLLEYIGKLNVSSTGTPHDIAWVVRAALHNQPISLVAGSTTTLALSGALNSSWDVKNLSVISFVQDNATKSVENANFALVTNLLTNVSSSSYSIDGGNQTSVVVHVTNSSTGGALSGATVQLSASNGGTFSPQSGTTLADGTFTSMFTAPRPSSLVSDVVTANISAPNYTQGTATTTIVLKPLYAPDAPTALLVTPGVGSVLLNWTAPVSGASGLTYSVYSASALGGPYALLANTTSASFDATGLALGQTVWFTVAAANNVGLSPSSGAAEATSVNVTAVGLTAADGWWLTVGTQTFTAQSTSSQILFMASGSYTYTFGTHNGAYEPTASVPSGTFTVTLSPKSLALSFSEKLGTLKGTVDPVSAAVTFNGAALEVQQGSFTVSYKPGTYYLNTSSGGYQTNSQLVTLAPGVTTNLTVTLNPSPASPSGSGGSSSALGGIGSTFWIGIGLVVVVVGAVIGMVTLRARGRGKGPGL